MKIKNNFSNKDVSKIPYCENPAVAHTAPDCSEDCCKYGKCTKGAYYKYVDSKLKSEKESQNNDKSETGNELNDYNSLSITIAGKRYSFDTIYKILKKHSEESGKTDTCDICGSLYSCNNIDMLKYDLGEEPKPGSAVGYLSTPFIRGIRILSTSGLGREIKLCDKCIGNMLRWLRRV